MLQPLPSVEGLQFTPEALDALLTELNLFERELARLCGVNPTTAFRWIKGETPIPHAVIRMLRLMVLLRQMNETIAVPRAKAA